MQGTIHILYPYPLDASGSGILTQELANRFAASGRSVHLLTLEAEPYSPPHENCTWHGLILGKSFPSERCPVYTGIGRPYVRFRDMPPSDIHDYMICIAELCHRELAARYRPGDTVLVSHVWMHSLILKDMGIPVHGIICHGTDLMSFVQDSRFEQETKQATAWSQSIIATSDFVLNEVVRLRLKGRAAVRRIYPGIDTDLFQCRLRPAETGRKRVAHIPGKLAHFKGTDRFLRAARMFTRELPDVETTVIAFGAIPAPIERLRKSLAHRVSWHENWLTRPDLCELLGSSSALIVPSRKEPFGMIAAEALCCGTPVVADVTGGVTEIVSHGDGAVVDCDDPRLLSDAVVGLLSSRNSDHERQARSHRASERFGWTTVMAQWYHWLAEVQGGSPE